MYIHNFESFCGTPELTQYCKSSITGRKGGREGGGEKGRKKRGGGGGGEAREGERRKAKEGGRKEGRQGERDRGKGGKNLQGYCETWSSILGELYPILLSQE